MGFSGKNEAIEVKAARGARTEKSEQQKDKTLSVSAAYLRLSPEACHAIEYTVSNVFLRHLLFITIPLLHDF